MRKSAAIAFISLGLLSTGTAGAESPRAVDAATIVGTPNDAGLLTGFIPSGSKVSPVIPGGEPPSRVIYLNNCKHETTSTGAPGCRITEGNDEDSRTNTSSIAGGNLAAYTGSDATWAQIVACVRTTYAPFNITITDTEPPASTSYWEAMAAGSPGNVGFPNGVGGVSPFSCGIIDNAITYSFLNIAPDNVDQACWIIAQETAHAFGLSHEMLGTDPMTYIRNPPSKRFQDESACIGTQGCCQPAQECQCGPTMQNSYQSLLAIFGPGMPTPPVVVIDAPSADGTVSAGFKVKATVTDAQGVEGVQLLIDGVAAGSLTAPPYTFTTESNVAQGGHTLTVQATDVQGTMGSASITVTVGPPCADTSDCAVQGADLVCVDGRCVPGANLPGGLGTTCTSATECASGLCAENGGDNKCTESCDPAADGCPDGFACLSNGAGGGLCWPGDSGGCGCATDGGAADPSLPIGAGLLLAAVLVRRRRRA